MLPILQVLYAKDCGVSNCSKVMNADDVDYEDYVFERSAAQNTYLPKRYTLSKWRKLIFWDKEICFLFF